MSAMKHVQLQGIALIVLGIIFLVFNFTEFSARDLWPLLLVAGGFYFFSLYFMNRAVYGVLMPGTILTVYGLMFLYCSLTAWSSMEHLWPLFIIAPGFGFLAMYLGGKRETGLLIPGWILTGIGGIFLLAFHEGGYLFPALLILLGAAVLLAHRRQPPATNTSGPS